MTTQCCLDQIGSILKTLLIYAQYTYINRKQIQAQLIQSNMTKLEFIVAVYY